MTEMTKRSTDQMNSALSQIMAGLAVMSSILNQPGAPDKNLLKTTLDETRAGVDRAFDSLRMIRNAAEGI